MSQVIILATESEGGGSAADLLLPAWPELVAGIIAFAIVFVFVRIWVWPSLTKTIELRQAAMQGQYDDAEKAKREAESLLTDYRAQLADSKAEGNRIIEEARGTAEQMKSEVVAKAQADADQLLVKAREEAESEKDRALADARKEVGSISVDLASQIVGESLDADTHKALVNRYLADLEKM